MNVQKYVVRFWMSILLAGILLLFYYNWSTSWFQVSQRTRRISPQELIVNLKHSHFWQALEKTRGSLLVNTSACKLPNFDPFDPYVTKLIHPWISTCSNRARMTYVENQTVVLNETEVRKRVHSIHNISCCYRTIERVRVEENLKTKKLNEFSTPDNRFMYSDMCYPMNITTVPVSGFIGVNCTDLGKMKIVYRNFHALAKLSKDQQQRIQPKFTLWKEIMSKVKNSPYYRPPSVLILGMDSTSRLHFRRSMNKTRKLLQKIGAIDMKGYTKIAMNTCPNMFNILVSHSYSLKKVTEICNPKRGYSKPMDIYDFLWNHFSNQSYVTGFFEDSPGIATFNHNKPGFARAPTDLYLRPWMLAAYSIWYDFCLGYQTTDEIILNYTQSCMTLLHAQETPYFLVAWWTQFTHGSPHHNVNGALGFDAPLSEMITTAYEKGMLENTVLFVMGDHGYRSKAIWETPSGWFEDFLPLMYIRLPESLKKRFPDWQEALEHNSQVLTSHWDTHETLKQILRLGSPNPLNSSTSPRGISLFEKIPPRNCKDANIPSEYCVCVPDYWEANKNNSAIMYCVEKVIQKINHVLPRNCAKFSAPKAKEVIVKSKTENRNTSTTDYTFEFNALPGNFKFRALVIYDNIALIVTKIPKVERINNSYTPEEVTSCLEKDEYYWESFCMCK